MLKFLCEDAPKSSPATIIIYVVLIVALIFILVAPIFSQKKRGKQMQEMLNGLRVGDLVETASGVIGRVTRIIDKGEIKTVILETGSKTEKSYIEVDLRVISMILKSSKVEVETSESETAEEDKAEAETAKVEEPKTEATIEAKAEESEEKPKKKKTSSVKKTSSSKKSK